MRIKFLRDAEYPQITKEGKPDLDRSKSYKAGEVYDLPDDHANRWLRRNAAVRVEEGGQRKKVEAMVPSPPSKGE